MEVCIQEHDIIIMKSFKHLQTKENIFFTYAFREQIKSARDLNPDFMPLDKDIYLVEIGNKKQTLKWLDEGKVRVHGDAKELRKILLKDN